MFSNKRNIGTINAMLRITFGLTALSWLTARMTRKPWKESYILMAMLAAMKVAEGILRYCPMTAAFGKGKEMYGSMMDDMMDAASFEGFGKENNPEAADGTPDQK